MTKRIAFLGEPWHGAMCRLESFMKVHPEYEYSFVNANVQMNQNFEQTGYRHPFEHVPKNHFESKFYYVDFKSQEYDLVLTLNDKFFDKVLLANNSTCPNLTDKKILNQFTADFGFRPIQTTDFQDDQEVFIKPIIGAGQFAFSNLDYKRFKYGKVKDLIDPKIHYVQEFLKSPLFTFVSMIVGKAGEIKVMDVSQAYHLFDYKGVSLNCYLESKSNQLSAFTENIEAAMEFIRFTRLDTVPGIYMTQFSTDFLNIIDFNVRTGPIADYVTLHGLYEHKFQRNLPFIVGDAEFDERENTFRYRCYLEDKDGKILSPLIQDPDFENRLLIVENKTSGLIRNDYNTYLEIISL